MSTRIYRAPGAGSSAPVLSDRKTFESYGSPDLCAYRSSPDTVRIQTSSPEQAERLRKLRGSREVLRSHPACKYLRGYDLPHPFAWGRNYINKQSQPVSLTSGTEPAMAA